MTALVISDQARLDLQEIVDYIARDNPSRAAAFLDELLHQIEIVGERPLSFPERSDWPIPMRSAIYRRYLIVFRNSNDRVEIIRVLHSARDIPALLHGDDI